MRSLIVPLLFLLFASTAQAVEPADSIIKNALADIQRYEQQASGLAPGQSAGASRILKLARISQQRLDGSPNKSDLSWTEVNERYVALETYLGELQNPSSTGTTPQSTPAAPATAAPATETSNSTAPPLVSGQRVQVKKLARDMAGVRTGIVTTGPSSFQDPAEIAARKKSLDQFAEALRRYPQVDDPDVQAARAEYGALSGALSAEFNRAQAQLAQLGDVQAALATLEENARTYPVPQALQIPFTADDANAWVAAASSARTVAEHNLQQLAIIAPIAYLPNNPGTPQNGAPYDADDVRRLQYNSEDALRSVQNNYQSMANDLSHQMEQIASELDIRWQEDPNNDEKRWLFISEGQQEDSDKVYADALLMAQSSVALEQAVGREPLQANALIAKINQAKSDFARNREIALNASRLPEPKSSDSELLQIASQILANPKYELGKHGKIVLTTREVAERERKDSEIEIDKAELTASGDLKMSGSETTWTYKWQEFKFATPIKEPDSDTWYIWWFTAKNFSSGGPRTPLNQWISGEVVKGNLILKKNT